MSYQLGWYAEDHVLQIQLSEYIGVGEMQTLSAEVLEALETMTGKIHILIDALDLTGFPSNPQQLRQAMGFMGHEHFGWMVLFGEMNAFNRFILSIVTQMGEVRFQHFKTYDEARAFLHEVDSRLNP